MHEGGKVDADKSVLRKRLREAGLSDPLIDAAWPAWWSEDAFTSESATAELRFSIARKLGLSPKMLMQDEVEFIWKDDARFKHLSNETEVEKSALTSFGISICRILTHLNELSPTPLVSAIDLRKSILQSRQFIDLQSLLAICWALGVPVIHLRIFPLNAKRMHAMAVKVNDHYSVLLGRDSQYPAALIFTLAHEIGHIMLGHIASSNAIVDLDDAFGSDQIDQEEKEADFFALELLLGTAHPEITTNLTSFNARQLAQAVLEQGPKHLIEPGTLALCLAYACDKWPLANASMPYIYNQAKPVWQEINRVAVQQLKLDTYSTDSCDYLL